MNIAISSIQVPFIKGGAQLMTEGLKSALLSNGHNVEIITIPFKFFPEEDIKKNIEIWKSQDFQDFSGYKIDKLISLQFPSYYANHPNKTIWLMHQHRGVYDLYDKKNENKKSKELKSIITTNDKTELSKCNSIYSMSQNISARLKKFNNIKSTPLYHPPANENSFFTADETFDFVFYPSRLETLKRQELLIKAMTYTKTPIKVIIAGLGGQLKVYEQLISTLNINHKIRLIGYITDEEKYKYYAHSLAVVFPPIDEDYGYITLEAMLSSKAIITCIDSGGPLEFIKNEQTGFVINPNPIELAQKLDWIYNNKQKTKQLGQNALEFYKSKNITWQNVVNKLMEN